MGRTCGRREGEADVGKAGESLWSSSFADGGRHLDSPDVGSLRGVLSERGSWSVPQVCIGSLSRQAASPTTKGALWTPRRGTSSACAKRMHSTRVTLKRRAHASRTRPSLGPEARARHAEILRGRGRFGGYRGRATSRKREKPAPGFIGTDENARLAARHRILREKSRPRDASEKERGHGLYPCEELKSPGLASVRRM